MSGDRYLITNQQSCYFLTFTVIYWIDIFTRMEYRDILVNSLNYCIRKKGLELNAWVIMTNHIHLVGKVVHPNTMSGFIRDFKKFTSKKIVEEINSCKESRREWLIDKFSYEAKRTGRAKNCKIWKDSNHAIDLSSYNIDAYEKINYIHMNPVVSGWVEQPEFYKYSSAADYYCGKGLVDIVTL